MGEWMIFAERIKKEMERKEMSSAQLAEKMGMTPAAICRYIKGQRVPKSTTVLKAAEVFGVTCDYLLGLSNDPHKTSKDIQPEQKWIPFENRPLTEEEKEEHPDYDFILDCKLPENGQRILVNIKYMGHEAVQMDEYYDDDGCYLDSGYEICSEATAWMPLPKPYEEGR